MLKFHIQLHQIRLNLQIRDPPLKPIQNGLLWLSYCLVDLKVILNAFEILLCCLKYLIFEVQNFVNMLQKSLTRKSTQSQMVKLSFLLLSKAEDIKGLQIAYRLQLEQFQILRLFSKKKTSAISFVSMRHLFSAKGFFLR